MTTVWGVFRASAAFRGRVGAVRVEGSDCNRAFDGDEVVVERVEEADALDEEEDDVRLNVGEDLGTSSGRVVGILLAGEIADAAAITTAMRCICFCYGQPMG